jgi:hypothetical protein
MTTLDRKYRDGLTAAMQVRDVPGDRIGEVLAEVETHVAETRKDPRQAFGAPADYARRIAEETGVGQFSPLRSLAGPQMLPFVLAVLTGSEVLSSAVLAGGAPVGFTASDLMGIPILLVVVLIAVWLFMHSSTAAMSAKARNGTRVAGLLVFVVGSFSASLVRQAFDDVRPVVELSSPVAYLVAAVFLIPVVIRMVFVIRRRLPVDPRSR